MIFDAHIHLDLYPDVDAEAIVRDPDLTGLIAVSMDLASAGRTLELKRRFPDKVRAACGIHPERPPEDVCTGDVSALERFIREHAGEIDAIGEVGLPYYTRREVMQSTGGWNEAPYLDMLDRMLELAAELDKPVILHGVREDVRVLLDRLEAHRIRRAHFHWLKTDDRTLERLVSMGFMVSFTPDILYEEETCRVAERVPLELLMAETDGPWEFEGPFAGRKTHPSMIRESVRHLAKRRGIKPAVLLERLAENAKTFIDGTRETGIS
ncbi:TatD family hydrolase [Staphylospora marina]|uniref:TatD family hydrolase n=1 Tax=Staphylospora marina TaxID=2490858 RepID=UPI000F5BDF4E|nr:TatD family hydrolase [Staphylospora marina]